MGNLQPPSRSSHATAWQLPGLSFPICEMGKVGSLSRPRSVLTGIRAGQGLCRPRGHRALSPHFSV